MERLAVEWIQNSNATILIQGVVKRISSSFSCYRNKCILCDKLEIPLKNHSDALLCPPSQSIQFYVRFYVHVDHKV